MISDHRGVLNKSWGSHLGKDPCNMSFDTQEEQRLCAGTIHTPGSRLACSVLTSRGAEGWKRNANFAPVEARLAGGIG